MGLVPLSAGGLMLVLCPTDPSLFLSTIGCETRTADTWVRNMQFF